MFNLFNVMPPVACYALAATSLIATYFTQIAVIESSGAPDSRVYVVGGIVAFLLGFVGFQRKLEQRDAASRPRVSSSDVLQKLSPGQDGQAAPELNLRPDGLHGPDADSPLGRVRSRTSEIGTWAAAPDPDPGKG
ncbi:MAG: hypothetical protein OIF48_00445 [Silicimonas sp.]|nr:hypothetical protein [Silicimonas sp.]